jgi:hypothetical protein
MHLSVDEWTTKINARTTEMKTKEVVEGLNENYDRHGQTAFSVLMTARDRSPTAQMG